VGRLTVLLAGVLLIPSRPAQADAVTRWRPLTEAASRRFGVPVDWIERVMRAESGGRPTLAGRPIRSRKGAIGLMQLMPGTWADMRARLALGPDPDDPHDNILAGTFYLRLMFDRFGYPGLFAAYNAGPARHAAWLSGRARMPSETAAYLARIAAPQGAPPPGNGAPGAGDRHHPTAPGRPPPDPLFAIRKPVP